MPWGTFFTFVLQGLIVLAILATIVFVGSAAWAAIREEVFKK